MKATTAANTVPITAASCLLRSIGDNYHPQNSHVIPALIRPLSSSNNQWGICGFYPGNGCSVHVFLGTPSSS